jgi:hypothetical protein
VTLTEGSGHGAFDITVEGIDCDEATALLKSTSGLRSWQCRVIAEQLGSQTHSCSSGTRVIVFQTEA